MSESDPRSGQAYGDDISNVPVSPSGRRQSDSSAFHSQFESFSQSQSRLPQYGQPNFDMSALGGALPHPGHSSLSPPINYGVQEVPGAPSPSTFYQMQQGQQFPGARGMQFDPIAAARLQQQQFQQYASPSQHPMMTRPQLPFQAQAQYAAYDPYVFHPNQFQVSPVDPRIGQQNTFTIPHGPPSDFNQYARRASEPAPIPSFPRGPPRKPKQSGHALWVGNLPPAATIADLKDHFSRDATKDIESLFLISKSNCAFVNYRSEAACVAAMNRFHDSRFQGVRLVCRLRRGAATGQSPSLGGDLLEIPSSGESPARSSSSSVNEEPSSPTIVGRPQPSPATTQSSSMPDGVDGVMRVSEKYFVVKSLTVQDLEASVRNNTWATQSHNETALNHAFDEADDVFLIFSANKSGEYFGYAKMTTKIQGNPVNLSSTFKQADAQSTQSSGVPQSIPTAATATAPKGRIIDDSARGTIFWEAELSDENDDDSPSKESNEPSDGQNWGRQFGIEWQSTQRLPFYRTRGLRNPWNANREVKIARDGTEIEPSVGRRLVQMFHRPSPTPQPGIPYQ